MVEKILVHLKENGWSADNIAFGSGGTSTLCINILEPLSSEVALKILNMLFTGALLQRINRDTQKCAFKCSYACVDGKDVSSSD